MRYADAPVGSCDSLSGSDPEDCASACTCSTGTGTTFNIEAIHSNSKLWSRIYRLKMIDYDGTFAYSRISSLHEQGAEDKMVVYPNPIADGKLTLNMANSQVVNAEVYSLTGILMLRCYFKNGKELNVSGLRAGTKRSKIVCKQKST